MIIKSGFNYLHEFRVQEIQAREEEEADWISLPRIALEDIFEQFPPEVLLSAAVVRNGINAFVPASAAFFFRRRTKLMMSQWVYGLANWIFLASHSSQVKT